MVYFVDEEIISIAHIYHILLVILINLKLIEFAPDRSIDNKQPYSSYERAAAYHYKFFFYCCVIILRYHLHRILQNAIIFST